MRRRFTRRSYPKEYRGLQQLHNLLSRIDVEKDALASPAINREHLPFFHKHADELFGGMLVTSYRQQNINDAQTYASLQQSTEYFLDILKQHQVYTPQQFTTLYTYADLPHNWRILAPDITEAVHDSGLSPHVFSSSISVLLNPGSYMDPGSRTRFSECDDAIGFETMSGNMFQDMGIPLKSLQPTLERDGSLTVQMRYDAFDISAKFANTFTQTEGPPYFAGNRAKNTWFASTTPASNKTEAKLYILCKELGDTLQVYYAAKQNGFNMIRNKVCFFTNDANATYRCILLQAPACISKSSLNATKVFHYHPVMEEIATKWKKLQLDALLEHNDRIISETNTVLNRRFYLQQNRRCICFEQTSVVADFLRHCIKTIRNTTEQFKRIPSNSMSLATYSKLASGFKALRLFNQQVVNRSAHSLFIKPTPTSPLFPDSFGDFLYSMQSGGRGDGGGGGGGGGEVTAEEEDLEYKFNSRKSNTVDYTTIDPTIPEQHLPITYVLNVLYTIVKEKNPDISIAAIRFMTEDIHSRLALFFGYHGTPLWSRSFLETIVTAYESGIFQKMTHADFATLIEPYLKEEEDQTENEWEWKLLESQVEQPNVEPYIAQLEAEMKQDVVPTESVIRPMRVKARTRKMRKV